MSTISQQISYKSSSLATAVEEIIPYDYNWYDVYVTSVTEGRTHSFWLKFLIKVKVIKASADILYLKNIYIRVKGTSTDYKIKSSNITNVTIQTIPTTIYQGITSFTKITDLDPTGEILYNIKIPDTTEVKLPTEDSTQLKLNLNFSSTGIIVDYQSISTGDEMYGTRVLFDNDRLTNISLTFKDTGSGTPSEPTTYICQFYDGSGTLIKNDYYTPRSSTVDISDIEQSFGIGAQTKAPTSVGATTYTVNYYLDSSKSNKVGSTTLTGGPGEKNYSHQRSPDTPQGHLVWASTKNGSGSTTVTFETSKPVYKFYPVFTTSITAGEPPSKLPSSFPAGQKIGYRSASGSRTNNTYYSFKTGSVVSPGSDWNESLLEGTSINLYLNWTPAVYTIRFNIGNGEGWKYSANKLSTITKSYGTVIRKDTLGNGYPNENAVLVKTGYLQYGWTNLGSMVHKSGDNSVCTYKYASPYNTDKQDIDDRWYNDALSTVDVFPCWYLINHQVITHYFTNKNGSEISDSYDFNIESTHLSIGKPAQLGSLSHNWLFLGWVQDEIPTGTYIDGNQTKTWTWGITSGSDVTIRNRGTFRNLEELGKIQYSATYGVNSNSLTKADWNNTSKNINIYALWSIDSRYLFIGNEWRPVSGIWVFVGGSWRRADQIWRRTGSGTWNSEVVE